MGRPAELNRDRIVSAALDLLDEGGVQALSMRGLAGRLGVKAASLYHHISGQDDLIDALQDEVNRRVDLSLLLDHTREGLAAFARSYRDAFARHPSVVDLVARRVVTAPQALATYDALAAHLLARGLPARDLMPMLAVLDYVVLGSAGETLAADFRAPETYSSDYPSLATALRAADRATADDQAFEAGLDYCLSAIDSRLELAANPVQR